MFDGGIPESYGELVELLKAAAIPELEELKNKFVTRMVPVTEPRAAD